jgi:hypothetical protein
MLFDEKEDLQIARRSSTRERASHRSMGHQTDTNGGNNP